MHSTYKAQVFWKACWVIYKVREKKWVGRGGGDLSNSVKKQKSKGSVVDSLSQGQTVTAWVGDLSQEDEFIYSWHEEDQLPVTNVLKCYS